MSGLFRYKGTFRLNDFNNLTKVAPMVEEVLKGKPYHFVATYEYKNWRPEIHENQLMEKVTSYESKLDGGESYGGFHVCDTYGVWGVTFSKSQDKEEHIDVFENGLEIYQRPPAGMWTWWMIVVADDYFWKDRLGKNEES